MNDIFFDYSKILSYNATLNFIIGERGCGKSYAFKKFIVKHFLKKNKRFVYIRRYKTELKVALFKNSSPSFFNQIADDPDFTNVKLTNKKDSFYINDKLAGYAVPLSTGLLFKSSTFENVDTIIFDEFLINKGNYHYLQSEVTDFLDAVESIARLNPCRCFLIGNAISITNPYFDYFNLSLPYFNDIKLFKNNQILVNYIKNPKYREVKKNTNFGKLVEDTPYASYAIDNKFLLDNKAFVRKKSKNAKFLYNLCVNHHIYGVWVDYDAKGMFISNKFDPSFKSYLTLNPDDHSEKTLLVRARSSPYFKSIIENYKNGFLFFDSQSIKNNVLPFINKAIY